jgi:hypothetical protein
MHIMNSMVFDLKAVHCIYRYAGSNLCLSAHIIDWSNADYNQSFGTKWARTVGRREDRDRERGPRRRSPRRSHRYFNPLKYFVSCII